MLRRDVVISELAYDVLWELGVDTDKHVALFCPSPGATWTERERLAHQVVGELQQLGLAQGDRPDPDLMDALQLLARPEVEVYGWFAVGDRPTESVVVAVSGREGVLAHLGGGQLRLRPVAPEWLCDAAVSVLPPLRPIRGQHHNVPTELLEGGPGRHGNDDDDGGGVLESVGGGETEVDRVRRLLAQPRRAAGQFFAATRGPAGGRRRCEYPVNVVDTAEGCYLAHQVRGGDGQPWTVVVPTDQRVLAERLGQLVHGLSGR
ncbi:EspG family protein [Streptoalloteichus tenebrarius]|uniref:EspG family protein n=1 Tax=Streptoalloteichus tenebrarius (strain ATCC 17920 / DSM 40477 / JCM 4838 / CBS 697.72 / NBRC 16177 / NCIMB 11028 / NRRL B-12390 / A12253. 1 / ISP 5477) TaxID=1933 RepID=A0ABT1HYS0_STRSD|nr:ESX secretion-associated protein EspG [Streptoalloteichus tenebrarius]MCP2260510.1 EspG family protein [Streptoalloteichus tenebrarius]BFF02692.1 ESX secretion-associated protein EspG [Streptoalloteichus tenebrarius]